MPGRVADDEYRYGPYTHRVQGFVRVFNERSRHWSTDDWDDLTRECEYQHASRAEIIKELTEYIDEVSAQSREAERDFVEAESWNSAVQAATNFRSASGAFIEGPTGLTLQWYAGVPAVTHIVSREEYDTLTNPLEQAYVNRDILVEPYYQLEMQHDMYHEWRGPNFGGNSEP